MVCFVEQGLTSCLKMHVLRTVYDDEKVNFKFITYPAGGSCWDPTHMYPITYPAGSSCWDPMHIYLPCLCLSQMWSNCQSICCWIAHCAFCSTPMQASTKTLNSEHTSIIIQTSLRNGRTPKNQLSSNESIAKLFQELISKSKTTVRSKPFWLHCVVFRSQLIAVVKCFTHKSNQKLKINILSIFNSKQ